MVQERVRQAEAQREGDERLGVALAQVEDARQEERLWRERLGEARALEQELDRFLH